MNLGFARRALREIERTERLVDPESAGEAPAPGVVTLKLDANLPSLPGAR